MDSVELIVISVRYPRCNLLHMYEGKALYQVKNSEIDASQGHTIFVATKDLLIVLCLNDSVRVNKINYLHNEEYKQ